MLQAKFSVDAKQTRFLNRYKTYGFKDKSSFLRAAIDHYKEEIELENLKKSADLYCEIYSEDDDLKELTDAAVSGRGQLSPAKVNEIDRSLRIVFGIN